MFPADFYREGLLHADTRFGDFPHYLPADKWTATSDSFTGWMLLSYRKTCTASSSLSNFAPLNVADENPRTFWVARTNQAGEWLKMDLGASHEIRAVQVNFTDYKSDLFASDTNVYTQFRVLHSLDGAHWSVAADLTHEHRDRPNAYVQLDEPVRARYLKYEHVYVASPHLAISDLRVFGRGNGDVPESPRRLKVRRDSDKRNAFISWQAVPSAVGYNVLWGIQPDKLYQTYQVFADQGTKLELRALTVGQAYSIAVEAFNENGVSTACCPLPLN